MSPVVDLVLPPAEDWQAQARAARISTADLLTQRMQVHEKTAWMLRANLG
jgi:DNA-binding ferritin-like protein